ncbi:MAG: NAD-dependent dehydratase [Elusimicrobiota bacterium]|nr:NAD-dependent dehydratase [Elusimicrobiota bacterium]
MSRRAALAGATGLVGGFLLERLLADPATALVCAPTRRPLPSRAKLDNPRLDGAWALPPIDEAYCALGTTRRAAGSAAAFRAVDLDLVAAFAAAARAAGARRFGLVSSVGADAASRFLYPRTKGEAERAVSSGFESVVLARPSFLLGPRGESRPGERLAIALAKALEPVLPRRWRGVPADAVAAALLRCVRGGVPGVLVLENEALGAI